MHKKCWFFCLACFNPLVGLFAQKLTILQPDAKWLLGEPVALKVEFSNKRGHTSYFYPVSNNYERYINPKKLDILVSHGHVSSGNVWWIDLDNFNFKDSIVIRVNYLRSNVTYTDKLVLRIPEITLLKTYTDTNFRNRPLRPVFSSAEIQFKDFQDDFFNTDPNKIKLMNKLVEIKSNLKFNYDKVNKNYSYEINKYETFLVLHYYEKLSNRLLKTDSFPVNFVYDMVYIADGKRGRAGDNGGWGQKGSNCQNGGDGGNGGRGEDGYPGDDLKITIERYNEETSVSKVKIFTQYNGSKLFYIDLSSGGRIKVSSTGGTGGVGGSGGDGGSAGDAYSDKYGTCDAGREGNGGDAGDGGNGGDGGSVEVYLDEFNKKHTLNIAVVNNGGVGGAGGSSGSGYRSGSFGSGGRSGAIGPPPRFYPFESFLGW